MEWIESDHPLLAHPAPARPSGTPSLDGVSLRPTARGVLAIRSENGAWVHLSAAEAERFGQVVELGPEALDQLWERGVLAVDGATAFGGADVLEAIGGTQDTFMLVLLLNEGCNLVCSYCYLGHATPSHSVAMPDDIARAAIRDAFDRPVARVLIDFGEVTVAERQFRELARHARELATAEGRELVMSIQTNGTTMDDELADFLAEHGVSAGISIDGPAELHDAARVFRSGRGSHALARDAVRRCAERGVSVHVPVTVAAHNVDHPDAVLDEVAAVHPGSHLLKPVLPQGEAAEAWSEGGITVDQYAAFMGTAIRRAAAADLDLLDTTALKFLRRFVGDRRGWGDGCTSRQCGSGRLLQVVDRFGDRHSCPRFVSHREAEPAGVVTGLTIGRRPTAPADLLAPSLRTPPPTCEGCAWLRSCGGGCTLAAQDPEGRIPLPDPHCDAHDAVHVELVASVLPQLLDGTHAGSRAASGLRARSVEIV